MGCAVDISGQKFGRLTAISVCRDSRGKRAWKCVCECGREATVSAGSLRFGGARSCGCLQRDLASMCSKKHGESRVNTREYRIWRIIKSRCTNTRLRSYAAYGGRGIQMCREWAESYERFLADMGRSPPGTSVDRIDNSRGYEPGNCRWATREIQAHNKGAYKTNKVGFRGVCMLGERYRAQIMANGKKYGLGTYDTLEQALAARLAGEERFWCGVSP